MILNESMGGPGRIVGKTNPETPVFGVPAGSEGESLIYVKRAPQFTFERKAIITMVDNFGVAVRFEDLGEDYPNVGMTIPWSNIEVMVNPIGKE